MRTGYPFAAVPAASSRWDPIADSEEGHYTHYIYPAAWFRLDFRLWWQEYRFTLMAAVPWSLTWTEYLERYRLFQGLDEALRR